LSDLINPIKRCSLLSSSYRFRPIATGDILGDLNALREGNMEMYGRQSTWDTYSPVARIGDYDPLYIKQRLRGTLSLNWRLFDGFAYHTDFTLNQSWEQDKKWGGAIYNNYLDDETGAKLYAGNVEYTKRDSWGLRWTNTVSYDFNFLPKQHRLNILLGHEVTDSGGSKVSISASHFPSNFTKDNAFAMINQYDAEHGTSKFSSGVDIPGRILSFFGRANYTLMDRYLFTVTFRADGSSKFSPEHRWGYFPAAAFGWRLSEESFMEGTKDWLDNLKVRLSYGTVGNDGISSDLWSQTWTSETDLRYQYILNNQYSSSYDLSTEQMANKNLKWETTITRNLGFDFGFLKNRLWGSLDLYWNTTKDLLMLTSLPGITGFTSTYDNIGQTSNKGIEFSLSGVIYENKDWNITAGMNINFNKGKVDKLAENVTGLHGTYSKFSSRRNLAKRKFYGYFRFGNISVHVCHCSFRKSN
jgi:outer membrane receptor protein involved in Fe transport